jgi:hypothetical protein
MDDFIGFNVDREERKGAIWLWWGDAGEPNVMTFYFNNKAQWRAISSIARIIVRYGSCRVWFGDSSQLIVPNDGSVISINL